MTSFGPSPPVSSYPRTIDGGGSRGRDGAGGNAGGGASTIPRPLNYGYGAGSVPVQYSPRSGSAPRSSESTSSSGRTMMSPPASGAMPLKGRVILGPSNGTSPSSGGVAHYPTASRVPVNLQPHQPTSAAPSKGTLRPGQEVVVGAQKVVVDRYLSEGGYAHVYLTHSHQPIGPNRLTTHCLKRIAFQPEQAPDMLKDVQREIDVMKVLSEGGRERSKWIVEYLDSSVTRTQSGGWEVFILMEFCAGGGIIDLLNKRLRNRLKEVEILHIFVDVCEAVAFMHHLPQPLLHRDLKIENILSHPKPNPALPSSFPTQPTTQTADLIFKVCDFGSTTFPATHPPRTKQEAAELAYDLNRHTTLQYRSPEMVEPLLGLPVGLPADVWALGVLLYKLCYYTTPFEEHGPLAIVNAKYTFPGFPVYSPPLQHLIASMLVEQPMRRPTVFQVLQRAHELRGTKPERDYIRSQPQQTSQSIPVTWPTSTAPSSNLLDFTDPSQRGDRHSHQAMQAQMAASIAPQRRGRPTKDVSSPAKSMQSPAPTDARSSRPTSTGGKPDLLASLDEANTIPTPKIQVTGDRNDLGPPKPAPTESSATSGFGDAFGAPSSFSSKPSVSPRPPTKGFSDSFDGSAFNVGKKVGDPQSRQTMSPPSGFNSDFGGGFGDSFAPPVQSSKLVSPIASSSSRPSSTAPTAPSQSVINGELSFEDRYPSLEALMADASSSNMLSPPSGGSGGALPTSRPTSRGQEPPARPIPTRQPSDFSRPQHVSITGGTQNTHRSIDIVQENPPLPNSTHVTGTAFRQANEGDKPSNLRPSMVARNSESTFSKPDDKGVQRSSSWRRPAHVDEKLPRPQSLQVPNSSSSRFQTSFSPPASSRAPIADLLTGEDTPTVDSDMHSLIEPMPAHSTTRGAGPPPLASKPKSLSISTDSNAAALPETGSRPDFVKLSSNIMSDKWSPLETAKAAISVDDSKVDRARGLSPHTSSSAVEQRRTSTSPGSKVPTSPKIQERMSYFEQKPSDLPTRILDAGSAGPSDKGRTIPPSPTAKSPPRKMPQPVGRRSSINAIVSRFEAMASPADEGKIGYLESRMSKSPETSPIARSRTQKPPVAPKPQQHRQSVSETTRGGSNDSAGPSTATRPEVKRKPTASLHQQEQPSSSSVPESSSPEEHASVSSLISRWNQGGPPAQATHPLAVKSKPALGQGRRL